MLSINADQFHHLLTPDEKAEVNRWFDEVRPGRYWLSGEMVEEGRIKFRTILRDLDASALYWDGGHREILTTAISVADPPPPCLVRAMSEVARC